jgi:hypothetical protein
MVAPFAAIEARINAAAFAHVANATADFGAGLTVDGIFDNGYAEAFGLVGGSKPSITLPLAAVASVVEGASVSINAVSYTVATIENDGAGARVMHLETV